MDLMPTFLSVAGAKYPDAYKGEEIVPVQGVSLIPSLQGDARLLAEPRRLGWTAYGMDAFREGNWKVLRLPEPYGNGSWQLYDLDSDPGETRDLSSKFPDRTAALANGWEDYAKDNGVIIPDSAIVYAKPIDGRKY
jgi:arylsulfatase